MSILFICGSLEEGKNGVGDYSRRLAGELIRQGHDAFILAINDEYIDEVRKGVQQDLNTLITTYRLPKSISLKEKKQFTKSFIDELDPEWLSLQYVPFSFNNRGLPYFWNRVFKEIGRERKWHLMFHEPWIIKSTKIPKKHLLLGRLQKKIINNLRKIKEVKVVTTTNPTYQKLLQKGTEILPLFGNVPLEIGPETPMIATSNNSNTLKIIHFSSFTNIIEEFELQIIWCKKTTEKSNLQAQFYLLGNSGSQKKKYLEVIEKHFGKEAVNDIGFLSISELSAYFSIADLALSRANYKFFQKSSSTISILEYGVPVLLRGDRPSSDFGSSWDKQLYFHNDTPLSLTVDTIKTHNPQLENVASKLCELLKPHT